MAVDKATMSECFVLYSAYKEHFKTGKGCLISVLSRESNKTRQHIMTSSKRLESLGYITSEILNSQWHMCMIHITEKGIKWCRDNDEELDTISKAYVTRLYL